MCIKDTDQEDGILCNFDSKNKSIHIYILPFPPSIRHCKNMRGVLLQNDASFAITTTLCVVYIGREGRPNTLVNQ